MKYSRQPATCLRNAAVVLAALLAAAVGAQTVSEATGPLAPTVAKPSVPAEMAQTVFDKYQAALTYLAGGRTRAAMEALQALTTLAPDWTEPHDLLGFLHKYYNERAKAIEHYKRAWQLDPTDFHATQALIALGALTPEQAAATVAGVGVEVFEQQIIDLTNQARAQAGLQPLKPNAELRTVAVKHSEEMRDLNYFSHYSPTPGMYDVLARYRSVFKSVPYLLGENLARRYGTEPSLSAANIQETFNDLMRSETHRRNILEPRYTETAVGIAVNERGDYWMTQLFRREAP